MDEPAEEDESSADVGAESLDREELIQAYRLYSEESRYRDGLMHNSYYLILIAAVMFSGQLLTLETGDDPLSSPRVWFAVVVIGLGIAAVGAVMNSYQSKRVNAEDQRNKIEEQISERFGVSGEDNPFTIQSDVVNRNRNPFDSIFLNWITVTWIAIGFMMMGLFLTTVGFLHLFT